MGDPVEVEAISHVFHHRSGKPTLIGGVKPNLGHSEGASGISSIIKVVLALEKGVVPATIGVNKINPSIMTDEWNIRIATSNCQWPSSLKPRASINSFGFGGANSHAILEGAASQIPTNHGHGALLDHGCTHAQSHADDRLHLLIFSARTKYSLTCIIDELAAYSYQRKGLIDLRDLAYTLNCRRSKLTSRGYLVASGSSLGTDLKSGRLNVESVGSPKKLPFAFVYTGQGSQWPGMGSQLIHQYTRFRDSIRYLDSCLQMLSSNLAPSWSLETTLCTPTDTSDIHSAEKSQPVCIAVQIALTDLLYEWAILPSMVFGHSSGEIGAAYAAGHLTARQAIMAAYCRGLAVSRSQCKGAMLVVGFDQSNAHNTIAELATHDNIVVACINSPESCTLSGDAPAIDKLHDVLQARNIFVRKLETNGKAYHSHHMKAAGPLYQSMLESVWHTTNVSATALRNGACNEHERSSIRMVSTTTGVDDVAANPNSPAYWRENLESPVRFEEAVRTVLEDERYHFIEIGPHSSLELPIKQTATCLGKAQDHYLYSSALVRGKDATITALGLVGKLFLHGHDEISFERIIGPISSQPKLLVDLPPYPWDYTAPVLWNEPRSVHEFRNRRHSRHDLLGSQVPGGDKSTTMWRNILDINEVAWLKDHCLGPSIVFPAAAYIAMAIEAMSQVSEIHLYECPGVNLRNFNFLKALDFHADHKPRTEVLSKMRRLQISNTADSNRWWRFSVTSLISYDAYPVVHVNGLVSLSDGSPTMSKRQLQLQKANMEQQAVRVWYDKFTKEGLNWGPRFAVMEEIFCDRARQAQEATATTHLLRGDSSGLGGQPQYIAHPISIDSMLQTAFVATTGGWVKNLRATVPVTMDSFHISGPALLDMDTDKQWSIDTVSDKVGFGAVRINAEMHNSSDQVLVRMNNVRCIAYHGNAQGEALDRRSPLVRVVWKPDMTALAAGPNANFSRYVDWFAENCAARGTNVNGDLRRIAGALDLIVHKRPTMRILEIGGQPEATALFLSVLRAETPLRRFSSYFKGFMSADGRLQDLETLSREVEDGETAQSLSKDMKFDLVIFSAVSTIINRQPFKCLQS